MRWSLPLPYMKLGRWLDQTERSRLERLLRPGDRDLFATARAALKSLVSDLAAVPPEEVGLEYTCPLCDAPHGRPQVASPRTARCLDVSISHSGQRVLVAASIIGSIGVDVEALAPPRRDLIEAVELALDDSEILVVNELPLDQRDAGVLKYWVRKEAMLKCAGVGLRGSPGRIRLGPPDARPIVLAWHAPEALSEIFLRDIDLGSGYHAALAVGAAIESEPDVDEWAG